MRVLLREIKCWCIVTRKKINVNKLFYDDVTCRMIRSLRYVTGQLYPRPLPCPPPIPFLYQGYVTSKFSNLSLYYQYTDFYKRILREIRVSFGGYRGNSLVKGGNLTRLGKKNTLSLVVLFCFSPKNIDFHGAFVVSVDVLCLSRCLLCFLRVDIPLLFCFYSSVRCTIDGRVTKVCRV